MSDHVFICYSRKDEDFVIKLATNLKRQGVPVWLDQWDIPSGTNWPRAIDRALSDCASLLVILSHTSVESDDVQSEWYAALDEKKIVVPILYQPCRIPFRLKPIQHVDFTARSPDDETSLKQVLRALGRARSTPAMSGAQSEPEKNTASYWLSKSTDFGNQGEYDEVITAAEKAIALDPQNVIAWNNKAIALDRLERYDESLKASEKAIALNPNYASAWNTKGNALKDQGKNDEAILAYDKAIKLDPKYAFAWNNKGNALHNQGKYDEAIRAYNRAIEIDPQQAAIWANKGNSLEGMSKHDEALQAHNKSIQLDPKFAQAWIGKSIALKRLGRDTEASTAFVKAKELGYAG
ncbi:MAG: toll/interleukin-1 receptor domain-containing protein [Methanothrix sp.]